MAKLNDPKAQNKAKAQVIKISNYDPTKNPACHPSLNVSFATLSTKEPLISISSLVTLWSQPSTNNDSPIEAPTASSMEAIVNEKLKFSYDGFFYYMLSYHRRRYTTSNKWFYYKKNHSKSYKPKHLSDYS